MSKASLIPDLADDSSTRGVAAEEGYTIGLMRSSLEKSSKGMRVGVMSAFDGRSKT